MGNFKNLMRNALAVGLVILAFGAFRVGVYLVKKGSSRGPAAIPRNYDYSHLEGQALQIAKQDGLLRGARVVSANGEFGIELGHFVAKNNAGAITTACEIYDSIELTFYAGNMAVSGEPPEMVVTGDCSPGDDISTIAPLMIPYQRILGTSVRDRDFDNFANESLQVTFHNVSDEWPVYWALQSIRLTDEDGDELRVNLSDIQRILGKTLALEFR